MMSGRRNIFPFTANQWEELQHQALIFKYIVSGITIPPHLLFTFNIQRSSNLQHVGLNCFLGRKVDPEPGRCRRTDGKKWRCSKQAYTDSKYCERHMHRGKDRSRKPVEEPNTTTMAVNPSTVEQSLSLTLSSSQTQKLNDPFVYPNASRTLGIGLSLQENPTFSLSDSSPYPQSQTNKDYRLKQEVATRSFSGSSMDDDSWKLMPLTMNSSSSKQRNKHDDDDDGPCYVLGSEIKCERPTKLEKREPNRKVHRFFDEWPPPKHRDSSSWLDKLDDINYQTVHQLQQSTSLSVSSSSTNLHDFPIFNSRSDDGG